MKLKFVKSAALIGVLCVPVVSYADMDTDATNAKTYVKDSVITTKIKSKLAAERFGTATQIQVETDSAGAVVLRGVAASDSEAKRAISIARETEGVTSVDSELKVVRQP